MSGSTVVVGSPSASDALTALRAEHNHVVTDLETLRAALAAITAKLDADGGVTDTNYAALTVPAAATLVAANVTLVGV